MTLVNSSFVLPRNKDWSNRDQAVPLKAFLRSTKMKPIKCHAHRNEDWWLKKTTTMDIYSRFAVVYTTGETYGLCFDPENFDFGDNVFGLTVRK